MLAYDLDINLSLKYQLKLTAPCAVPLNRLQSPGDSHVPRSCETPSAPFKQC